MVFLAKKNVFAKYLRQTLLATKCVVVKKDLVTNLYEPSEEDR